MTRHTRKLTSPRAGELPLAIGQLKANGCNINLYDNLGFTLSSDISAVKDANKLDFSDCCLSGACKGMTRHTIVRTTLARAGDVSDEVFSLLCTLDTFRLEGNPGINQKTLAGHLACTFTNLKDQPKIDVQNKGLGGAWYYDQTYPNEMKLCLRSRAQGRCLR